MQADTIPSRLLKQAKQRGNAPAYCYKQSGKWQTVDWKNYSEQVMQAAKSLKALGLKTGDSITILGFNRPEWAIMDMACMCIGGVPAGIYTTCPANEVQYITGHCEAPIALAENKEQWQKFKDSQSQLPKLKKVVLMEGADVPDDDLAMSWQDFMAAGQDIDTAEIESDIKTLKAEQLATLIYTSGTTGPPKGVMLSHDNLAWTAQQACALAGGRPDDRSLSYLPLSHIAEQMFTLHLPTTVGSCVWFAESIAQVKANLLDCRPTMFFGVPRIWEKFYAAFKEKGAETTGLKKKIATWAKSVGAEVTKLKNQGKSPTGALALKYKLANKLVFSKVRDAVGFDHLRIAVSGAAPISADILEFFGSLDITIHEVYGQSEGSGPTSFNAPGRTLFGSVGPAFPGVDIRIADDGEILVRGRNIFQGYFKDKETTDATLEGEWLHSGDLGQLDNRGFLHITGRKKDIIITAGGKNVTPKNMESAMKNLDIVGNAVVIGDKRKYLIALVSLDADQIDDYAAKHNISPEDIFTHKPLVESIDQGIKEMNKELHGVEQIKRFRILPRPLSIEEGELTPTLKVKRSKVNEIWADLIDEVYAD